MTDAVSMMTEPWVTSDVIARAIGCSPQALRVAARSNPGSVPWPVIIVGSRVYHSREGYLSAVAGNRVNNTIATKT